MFALCLIVQKSIRLSSKRCMFLSVRQFFRSDYNCRLTGKSAMQIIRFLAVFAWLLMVCASDFDFAAERFVTLHLTEELPAGTVVGNLYESVSTVYGLKSAVAQDLKFKLNVDDHWKLDVDSGMMTTRERVDRERICPPSSRRSGDICAIVVQVRVSPVNLVGDIDVRVVIDDVNDHDPSFPSESVQVSFPESVASRTQTQLLAADDPDVGQNGRLSYELATASEVFELAVLDDSVGSADVFLRLKSSVDREEQAAFSLLVVAIDSGSPRRTGTLSVHVVISDVNDNPPSFNVTRYEFATHENQRMGSVIGRVEAADADEGDNGRVTYAVTRFNGRDPDDDCPLIVDTDTGDIIVVGQLDFELHADYVLTVLAADCAPPALRQFGYARVLVRLTDENDNAPEMTSVGTSEVAENSVIGTTVMDLLVSDRDSEKAGEVESCRVTDAADQQVPFTLRRHHTSPYSGTDRYSLVTEALLDRETVDRCSLMVVCVDAGVPPLTGQTMLQVRILDVNDNPPRFSHVTPISVSLPENNDVNDYVTTVVADDSDLGENATVSYDIRCGEEASNSSEVVLHIDSVTGVVRAAVSLDRERRANYHCVVVATDNGSPSLTSSANLLLSVTDVDDQLPAFESPEYEFMVAENQPAGSVVGRVQATDADLPPFNTIVYLLDICEENGTSDIDDERLLFTIDVRSGVVSTSQPLDRETDGVYFRFHVIAGNGSASFYDVGDRAAVRVHVTDVNDNSPKILFPSCTIENMSACEFDVTAPSPGDVITRVIAVDPDDSSDRRSPLLYELIDSDDVAGLQLFGVNSSTGEVYIRQSPVDGPRQFQLQVRVTDAARPPLSATVSLSIRVNGTTRPEPLGVTVAGRQTSKNLAVTVLAVAGAAVIICVLCFIAARRIGPVASDVDAKSDVQRDAMYVSAASAYISQSNVDDDVSCDGADCSTDVALGSALHVQGVVPAVIVDGVALGSVSSRRPAQRRWSSVHKSSQAADCQRPQAETRRLLVVENRDVYRVRHLDLSCQEPVYMTPARRLGHAQVPRGISPGQCHDRCQIRAPAATTCRCHLTTGRSAGETALHDDSSQTPTGHIRHHGSHVTARGTWLHAGAVHDAELGHDVDDRLARGSCGTCSVRQVALGAIVAGHLYNDTAPPRRLSDPKPSVLARSERQSLYKNDRLFV